MNFSERKLFFLAKSLTLSEIALNSSLMLESKSESCSNSISVSILESSFCSKLFSEMSSFAFLRLLFAPRFLFGVNRTSSFNPRSACFFLIRFFCSLCVLMLFSISCTILLVKASLFSLALSRNGSLTLLASLTFSRISESPSPSDSNSNGDVEPLESSCSDISCSKEMLVSISAPALPPSFRVPCFSRKYIDIS